MDIHKSPNLRTDSKNNTLHVWLTFTLLFAFLVGCIPQLAGSGSSESLKQTQMELSIQQTLLAQKATQDFLAQQNQQVDLSMQATQTMLAAQNLAAQQAMQATETSFAATMQSQQQPPADQPVQTQAPDVVTTQAPAQPQPSVDFETFKDSAKILLYEDMVNWPEIKRYVKAALDNMGLDYKDDGSAKGWLKSDVLSGGWDLIIVALENLNVTPTGEYFTYLSQALDQGSSVILDIWFLNAISEGEVNQLLSKCGIEYEKNYRDKNIPFTWDVNQFIVWPLPGKGTHPILNEPNTGFSWTNVTNFMERFWQDVFFPLDVELIDFGDFIRLNGKKPDSELLLGTLATEKNTHGVLAVGCDGRFIIQTFGSYNYAQEESIPLWENYIHNALKAKWMGSQ